MNRQCDVNYDSRSDRTTRNATKHRTVRVQKESREANKLQATSASVKMCDLKHDSKTICQHSPSRLKRLYDCWFSVRPGGTSGSCKIDKSYSKNNKPTKNKKHISYCRGLGITCHFLKGKRVWYYSLKTYTHTCEKTQGVHRIWIGAILNDSSENKCLSLIYFVDSKSCVWDKAES